MKITQPSPEYLRQILRYDPETGALYWRKRPLSHFLYKRTCAAWNAKHAGKKAGTGKGGEYIYVCVDGKGLGAHRVAYAIYHGRWPKGDIDHLNGATDDNRITNLRDVSRSKNRRNSRLHKNNKSGFSGIYWCSRHRRWRAQIVCKGKHQYLGSFENIEDAVRARKIAEEKLGFTTRHGCPA